MWPLWKVRVSCEKKVYVKVKVAAVALEEDQGLLVTRSRWHLPVRS